MSRALSHATKLVVVALPSNDDPVWRYSSEKAPHLTLLYLGKPGFDQSQIDLLVGYVEHASKEQPPFMLDVTRRGELGPDQADVLFFNQRTAKGISNFRTHLLQNDLISEAYLSTEQYPEWTPHLTMGYPTNPAKKDTREHPGFWYVNFDRIAVWTSDSEGPTFQLEHKDYDLEVAMSQIQRGRAFVMGDNLTHYGVKGMHWGVRKSDSGGGGSTTSSAPKPRLSEDAREVEKAFSKIERGGTDALSNKELQHLVNRLNLEQQYNRLTSEPSPQQANALKQGQNIVSTALGLGKTYNDVVKFLNSPAGKAVKAGFKAAKFGVKVYTKGPVGAAVDVVRPKNHFTNTGR